ncbi:hypothetical protein HFU84_10810 [Acidithiobacillus sp. CV18-2]|nr:hypothetical protein [Acidithiobacillus sp. CV18-3]MBU2756916.1 hypothetical protein [Acidithiobacillus sp. BN09-2]MBU2777986.1 hypothetical protein [Acidithiobacillus sp. CV18-2]MBU2799627.1 hypothetical protein [Acidithiobacillus sp. VAN18-4]
MEYIAEAQGLWYEGNNTWLRLIQNHPIILPIRLCDNHIKQLMFVEDYFNSSTRIRRGRIYERTDKDVWPNSNVAHYPYSDSLHMENPFRANRSYKAAENTLPIDSEVILGKNDSESYWTVVLSEKIDLDVHYLTLKSKTYFGVLPEIIPDSMPEADRESILMALEAVVRAAPIQAPQPVIDACLNATCRMICAKYPASNPDGKKDLGKMVKWLNGNRFQAHGDAADLVRFLHSRAKANAAADRDTRPVSQQDANLAVDAVAFLLQDFGWGVTNA